MAWIGRSVRWLAVAVLGAASLTAVAGLAATGAGAAGAKFAVPTEPVTLYVATTGTNVTNRCTSAAHPCQTIEQAVTVAGTDPVAVTIQVAQGTYHEQVSVPPTDWTATTTGAYGAKSLTIEPNPANTTPVTVAPGPTAFTNGTTVNLPDVPSTNQAYDGFGGQDVHAIIGVGEPSGKVEPVIRSDAVRLPYPALSTTVNITGLTLSGANNDQNPDNVLAVAGIAYVNASGSISGNTISDLNPNSATWSDNQEHGIDVRGVNATGAASPSYAVTITGNTVGTAGATETQAATWVGHVPIDVNSTGATDTSPTTAGSLSATISDNKVYGTPSQTASQNGIAAAGLTSLAISGNTVANLQSPTYSGGVEIGTQSPGASCTASGNQLVTDDFGLEFIGATGCTASDNTIKAGFFGVGVDAVPSGPYAPTQANMPSVGDTVSANTVSGATTLLTKRGNTGKPIDGVLVTDGATMAVTGNTISGFINDVYAGVDPLRYDGGAYGRPAWPTTTTPATATGLATADWSTAGTTVHDNHIGPLVTGQYREPSVRAALTPAEPAPTPVNGYGVACKYTPAGGGCSSAALLDATTNWWGSASGPGPVGPGSGTTVSTDVNYTPWWTTPTGAVPGVPGAPTTVVALAPSKSTLADAAQVSWTAPPQPVTPVTSYTVTPTDQTTGGQGQPVVTKGTATAATVTGLIGGDSYIFSVTATNAAGTGAAGTSNAVVPVKVTPTASSSSGTTIPSTGTATTKPVTAPAAAAGGTPVTVTASGSGPAGGAGTVTVSAYPSDPTGGFAIGDAYFDVSVTPGSTFTQVQFQVCGVPSGQVVQWWNPLAQAYQVASQQSAGSGPTRCVVVTVNSGTSPTLAQLYGTVFTVAPAATATSGYWLAASDGGVFTYGSASFYGSMGGKPLNKPVVGIAATPDNGGYWLVASDGGVFSFGNATFYGSMGGKPLNSPIVGIASTLDGKGYWEVAADGGVFAFGDATFYGSMGGKSLNQPVVGIAPTPDGNGYWLVAKDGGIFSYGDATFAGSMGGKPLNQPVVGIAAGPSDAGYWEVASDGGIFAFGTATFQGSAGSLHLNKPVVGIAATPTAKGYFLGASDGGIFSYGDAAFQGSAGSLKLVAPVVGLAD